MKYFIYFVLFIVCNAEKSLKIDIYPGFGWDHLRFIDMSPIFDVSNFNDSDLFQACVEMIPLHENKIETGSIVVDAFDARTADHSTNIAVGGSGVFNGVKIGGSYSYEYQKLKQEQGEEKTVTLRNHIDYLMVDVILQQTCPLNSQVKKDLIDIARFITTDQSLRATYAAQMFVKKYGTHFTSRLQLGGSISEDDYVSHTRFYASDSEKRLHKAAAEISFLGTYSLTSSFSSADNDTEVNQHKQNINRKVINSKGGDVFISGKHMEEWQASVKSRPAIIRRAIENMTYFIQSDKVPELTDVALGLVRQKINDAIDTYVKMNAVPGCMHRDSPSFNWVANVDDGSCAPAEQNSQFGGFVRSCSEEEGLTS
jgi:hypothetical protein